MGENLIAVVVVSSMVFAVVRLLYEAFITCKAINKLNQKNEGGE